ncbi:putative Apoptosis-inducing factor like protein A [Glarea lozoyensis 74030]|nr:putative Apoptosis-inducing factor like protein A [Glarea lozoyensis 74030]
MASELAVVHPTQRITLIHSHDRLLSSEPLPIEVANLCLTSLREQGVEVVLGQRVESSVEVEEGKYKLRLSNGNERTAGFVIWAISKQHPSTDYLPKEVHNSESGLVVIKDTLHFNAPGPFSTNHFAIGDLVQWSGIKRCGAAMHMGFLAANNIYQEILVSRGVKKEPTYLTYPEVPAMIALACGKQAISYSVEDGAKVGEDIMEVFFNDDLGFMICWNYLQLGTPSAEIEKGNTEKDIQILEEQVNDLSVKEKMIAGAVISAA